MFVIMAGQKKKRGGEKRQCRSTSLLITKNPLITDITINDVCVMGSTIEGSVFLAPRWGVEQRPLVAQPEVVALLAKLGLLHHVPVPTVKAPLFVVPSCTVAGWHWPRSDTLLAGIRACPRPKWCCI